MNNIKKNKIQIYKKIPIVITENKYPFYIKYVNKAWIELCQYSYNEIINKSIFILRKKKKIPFLNKKKNGDVFIHIFEIIHCKYYSIGITKLAIELRSI